MPTHSQRITQAFVALRLLAAAMLFIHGVFRIVDGGVGGFGEFLTAGHVPAGLAIAWGVTILEVIGTVALAFGWFIRPLALYFAAELAVGILLVHAPSGWFVVGGGRNGMEYSVTLIALFLAQAWAAPARARQSD